MLLLGAVAPVASAAEPYPDDWDAMELAEKNDWIGENVATYDDLLALLQQDDSGSSTLADTIAGLITPEAVQPLVTSIIDGYLSSADALTEFAAPLIKEAVAVQLGELGITDATILDFVNGIIDEALASDVVDTVLANDFTQDVIARTMSYAIPEVLAALFNTDALEDIIDAEVDANLEVSAQKIFDLAPIDVFGQPIKSAWGTAAATFPGYTTDGYREGILGALAETNLSYYTVEWSYPAPVYSLYVTTDALLKTPHDVTFTKPGTADLVYVSKWFGLMPTAYSTRTYTAALEGDQLCVTPTDSLAINVLNPRCVSAEQPGKPDGLKVTGWNAGVVKSAAYLDAVAAVAAKVANDESREAYLLSLVSAFTEGIDLTGIITDAVVRAVEDEITERVTAMIVEIRTDIYTPITEALAEYGIMVELDPTTDNLPAAGQKILDAFDVAATDAYNRLVDYLQAAPVVAPAVSDNPTVGQTASITPGKWDPLKTRIGEITYQWRIEGSDDVIGTGLSITVPPEAVGKQLSVTVTAPSLVPSAYWPDLTWQRVYNTSTVQKASLAVTTPLALDNPTPTIEEKVAVTGGEFSPAANLAYQWYVGVGDSAQPITGATGAELEVKPEHGGSVLSVKVTATVADPALEPAYEERTETLSTAAVIKKPTTVDVGASYTTTSPKVGQVVGVIAPEFSTGVGAEYQWYLTDESGVPTAITGATGAKVTVAPEWAGKKLAVAITSEDKTGWLPATVSLPALNVAPGEITLSGVTVTGRALVGKTLTAAATATTADANPVAVDVTYTWLVDGVEATAAAGAASGDGTQFTLAAGAVGAKVSVKATAEKTGYTTAVAESAAVGPVESNELTVTAAIVGTAQVGKTVSVETTVTPDLEVVWTYQWFVDGNEVSGANAASYVVKPGDKDQDLSVKATATPADADYPAKAAEATPVSVAAGVIELGAVTLDTVKPRVGEPVTVSVSSVTPLTADLAYAWYHGNPDGSPAGDPLGTEAVYTPVPSDVVDTLVAVVTATAEGYVKKSARVASANATVPGDIAVTEPKITGTPQVGEELTASVTTDPAGADVSYTWYSDGKPVATGATYTPVAADLDVKLTVLAVITAQGYEPTAIYITAKDKVIAGTSPSEGLALSQPTLEADHFVVGETDTATATAADGAVVTFEWFSDANATVAAKGVKSGANGEKFTPSAEAVDTSLYAKATASLAGYSETDSKVSAGKVVKTNVLSVTAGILGTARVGVELTASASVAQDAGATLAYEWKVAGVAVGTASTYTPTAADAGKTVTLTVTATPSGAPWAEGVSAPVESAAVAVGVIELGAVTLDTVKPRVGEPVTVSVSSVTPSNATLAYAWYHADEHGAPAGEKLGTEAEPESEAVYTPVPADVGAKLVAVVTATADGYETEVVPATAGAATGVGVISVTAPASIGTPKVGVKSSLPVVTVPADADVSHTWYRNGAAVATGADYTPVAADLGADLTVWALVAAEGYASTVVVVGADAKVAAGTVAPEALALNTPVLEADHFVVGETVTATATAADGAVVSFEWLADGAAVTAALGVVSGTSGECFTPSADAVGKTLSVKATASLAGYSETDSKVSAGKVVKTNVLSVTAAIVGTARVGVALTASASVAQDAGATLAYEWKVAGDLVGTASTYTPKAADAGKTVTLTATATPSGAPWAKGAASATKTVAKGIVTLSGLQVAPANPVVGVKVEAKNLASSVAGRTVTYTWYRADEHGAPTGEKLGTEAEPESEAVYTPVPADVGAKLVVVATAAADSSYEAATVTATSAASVALGTIQLAAPVISGTAQVGVKLSASAAATPTGATVTYTWYRAGKPVAADATYTPVADDLGQVLTVEASASAGGYGVTVASTKTAAVKAGDLALGALTVSPTPTVATASQASIASLPAGASVTYQWKLDGGSATTGATRTPHQEDQGKQVTVTAVVTLTGYNAKTLTWGPVAVQEHPSGRLGYASFTLSPDLNGDGRGEIVGIHHSGEVRVHPVAASGALGTHAVVDSVPTTHRVVAPGDLTSDGKADLFYIDANGKLYLKTGTGGYGFSSTVREIGWGWTGWRAIPAGDLNGDNKVDLLGINDSTGVLYFYPGRGDGTFGQKTQVGWGWVGWGLYSAGDLNGDKKLDILGINTKGELMFYPGRGDGTFGLRTKVGWGWLGYTLASGADLSGDGAGDIVGRDNANGKLYFYKGRGNGEFPTKVQIGTYW
ncbi:MAG: VCBS repeat-containing protein [Bifidobacteriaceae bacterium]|nr:VCBS repeat-containing protein [Bifidobacteriaceae bacterium]